MSAHKTIEQFELYREKTHAQKVIQMYIRTKIQTTEREREREREKERDKERRVGNVRKVKIFMFLLDLH